MHPNDPSIDALCVWDFYDIHSLRSPAKNVQLLRLFIKHPTSQLQCWCMLQDAKILDKSSGRCRKADADNVFVAANRILGVDTVLQHGKSEDQLVSLRDRRTLAVKYDLHGLHRFQFVAALIQLGIYKYKNSSRSCRIHTKSMDPSVAGAVSLDE